MIVDVAGTCRATRALGPGIRAVVWVQGCPLHCAGCVSPEWIEQRPGGGTPVGELVDELLADPGVTGLTFSGGEPMAQASALASVAREARRRRPLSLVCFSGFSLERLRAHPPSDGVADLLGEVDVLVDGPYVAGLDDGRGLRGSTNQRVHHLTDRLLDVGYDFLARPRTAEIQLSGGSALIVGVPPPGLLEAFDQGVALFAARRAATPVGTIPAGPARRPSDEVDS